MLGQLLAIDGGRPQRSEVLPYGRQSIDESDEAAVLAALRSDYLTTGPRVAEFERALASAAGTAEAVAVCNGTAALHVAAHAAGLGPGDEVIVPTLTFAATANCAVYQGARPVFADVDPTTLLLGPAQVAPLLTPGTKAILAVDYAGQPCDYPALETYGIPVIADASHAIGATLRGRPVGSLARMTTFSFHPVKGMTTGEGGAVATDDPIAAERMRVFRNHGITTDHRQRAQRGSFFYEMVELGYNYRLSDLHCALGLSQLRRLPCFLERRRAIAARYDAAFFELAGLRPLTRTPGATHAWHLYVVLLEPAALTADRGQIFAALRAEGIGAAVHYPPVHLHPYYRQTLGTRPGQCPAAEAAYQRMLSLPIFPAMTDADVDDVIAAVEKVLRHYRR